MRDVVAATNTATAHPLLGTANRLSALDSRLAFRAERPEQYGDWVSLREAAEPSVVRSWLDELPVSGNGMRNVAGARIGLSLACLVVRPLMATLHLEHRMPALPLDAVHLRREHGSFVELAVLPDTLYTLPADPDSGHPDTRGAQDFSHLLAIAAEQLMGALAPVLGTIRAEGRYGMRNLWGGVLDMIGATSLLSARIGRLPQQLVWRRVESLCDLVQAHSEQRAVRYPKPFEVSAPGGDMLFTVKGTCCLRYREHGLRAGEQADSAAYCKTCPFLREDTRQQRCASSVERDLGMLDTVPIAGA